MELNQEQIIKALECCTCSERANCADCPYDGDELLRPCDHNLMLDALALIRELTEENERLKAEGYAIFADDNTFDGYVVDYDDIDRIAKEMLGEKL